MDYDSKYLLTGLMKCGICGGGMGAITRERKRTGSKFYGCTYYQKRGKAICTIKLAIQQEILDRVILNAINQVLDEQLIKDVVDKALTQLRSGKTEGADRQGTLEKELSLLETKVQRIIDAIAAGQPHESLVARLKTEEDQKKVLLRELEILNLSKKNVVYLDEAKVKQDLRKRVKNMKGVLGRHPAQARQVLRKLLNGRITCTPVMVGESDGYQVTGQGNYHNFLPSTLVPILLASPTGFEPVLPA
ncbi:zinc ribbon domain-containing protein [Candidatus Nitrospira allomarina]|uniref:zinc ribbon domain-containing protein n=1 Tax=Candidatus Nitrospira allomarina TaxID=3020900 RepID=UPI0035E3DE09